MKTWTLRTRITVWSALVTAVALLVFGGAAAAGFYYRQVRTLDRRLADDAKIFFRDFAMHGVNANDATGDALLLFKSSARLLFFAIGPTGGRPDQVYPEKFAPLLAPYQGTPGISTVPHAGERIRLGVFADGNLTLVLGSRLHSIEESVGESFAAYLLALPLVLFAVGAGGAWIARRALQPIAELTGAAAGITAARLDARLPQPPTDDEIGRHVCVLNAMFDRLQRSFEQATRFTADASHELRTPLTILRGEIEEALRSGRFADGREGVLVSLLEQVDRLQKITGTLLLLARFDAGKTPLSRAPVPLDALTREIAEDAELLASPGGIQVRAEIAPDVVVAGDAGLLRRVWLNLADNAVRHNRPGGAVRLALRGDETARAAIFTIANTGPGIPPERHEELFQRFFRLAADRDRASGGTGLGLSLCREIVLAHGGQIALTRTEGDLTEFTVTLPLPT